MERKEETLEKIEAIEIRVHTLTHTRFNIVHVVVRKLPPRAKFLNEL